MGRRASFASEPCRPALSPGPDDRLYLVPGFIDDEASFEAVKAKVLQIWEVRTFTCFVPSIPAARYRWNGQ